MGTLNVLKPTELVNLVSSEEPVLTQFLDQNGNIYYSTTRYRFVPIMNSSFISNSVNSYSHDVFVLSYIVYSNSYPLPLEGLYKPNSTSFVIEPAYEFFQGSSTLSGVFTGNDLVSSSAYLNVSTRFYIETPSSISIVQAPVEGYITGPNDFYLEVIPGNSYSLPLEGLYEYGYTVNTSNSYPVILTFSSNAIFPIFDWNSSNNDIDTFQFIAVCPLEFATSQCNQINVVNPSSSDLLITYVFSNPLPPQTVQIFALNYYLENIYDTQSYFEVSSPLLSSIISSDYYSVLPLAFRSSLFKMIPIQGDYFSFIRDIHYSYQTRTVSLDKRICSTKLENYGNGFISAFKQNELTTNITVSYFTLINTSYSGSYTFSLNGNNYQSAIVKTINYLGQSMSQIVGNNTYTLTLDKGTQYFVVEINYGGGTATPNPNSSFSCQLSDTANNVIVNTSSSYTWYYTLGNL